MQGLVAVRFGPDHIGLSQLGEVTTHQLSPRCTAVHSSIFFRFSANGRTFSTAGYAANSQDG